MASSFSPPSASSAPLPPLPELSSKGQQPNPGDPLAAIMSGVAPVKKNVDAIVQACRMIVQGGMVPGSEQTCGQIVALAASLLPMAVQQAMVPGQAGGGIGPVGAGPAGPGPIGPGQGA